MRAVQITGAKDAPKITLAALPTPTPSGSQVLIRVHAAGITADEVTWPELYTRTTRIPGHDISGVITALGPEYTGPLAVGDDVYAMINAETDAGGQADYVAVASAEVAKKPTALTHAQAAALPIPFLTAWEALFQHAKVAKGATVLVTGASGAVGNMVVQIASRVLDCRVVGLASTRNHERVKALGAATVADYADPNWANGIDVDAVIDTVGGETLVKSWQCVKDKGSVVTVADPPPAWAFDRGKPDELSSRPNVNWVYFIVTASGEGLAQAGTLFDGTLQPLPVTTFKADDAVEAWTSAARRGRQGKVVIDFA